MQHRVAVLVLGVMLVTAGCTGWSIDSVTQPADSDDPTPTATASTTPVAPSNGTLEVHFINTGQSVATLLVSPTNETMLIDSGDWRDDGEHVLNYLKRHNISRIDYLITSHADADHIGGHAAVIEYFETEADGIGAVYDPGIAASTATYEEYLDAVERHNVTLYEARKGDTIPFENATVTILSPPRPYLANEDRNENSLVLNVTFGQTTFLFTGDAGKTAEEYLVDTYGKHLNATALQAGHHGSKTSTNATFLDTVQPRVVVISSAYDSQYGHPHEEVLQRLAACNITTYWTATHGNVVLGSDGQNVTIKTQQAAPTNASRLREGEPIAPNSTTAVETRATLEAGGDVQPATPTPTATDGGTPTPTPSPAEDQLTVAEIHADAVGNERENINDEYLVFENAGDEPLTLSGWQVEDEVGHTYTFPDGFTLAPGETVTLHTGTGSDTETDLYWGSGQPIWNNNGDTVIITNAEGKRVIEEGY